jgi:mannose-6-phosphate isomerase-like protein (cupin superfamily)
MDTSKLVTYLQDLKWIDNREGYPKDEGMFKRLISKDLSNSKDLNLGIGWLFPAQIHVLHHHPDASEFYFVILGTSKIIVEDRVIEAKPGITVYIPQNYKHKIINDSSDILIVLFGYNIPEYKIIWDE